MAMAIGRERAGRIGIGFKSELDNKSEQMRKLHLTNPGGGPLESTRNQSGPKQSSVTYLAVGSNNKCSREARTRNVSSYRSHAGAQITIGELLLAFTTFS